MRKVIKRSDGTEDVVEGTPQEIREYERIVEEEGRKQKNPPVLKGKPDNDVAERLRKAIEQAKPDRNDPNFPPLNPWGTWPNIVKPIWVSGCSVCGRAGCICNWWPLYPQIIC